MLKFKDTPQFDKNSKILPLEKLHVGQFYALTINPALQLTGDFPQVRFREVIKEVLKYITPNLMGDVVLRPELSTKKQNIHFHGWIRFRTDHSILRFYMNLSKIMEKCQIEIDTIGNFMIWYLYCVKQRHLMKPLFNQIGEQYKIISLNRQGRLQPLSVI